MKIVCLSDRGYAITGTHIPALQRNCMDELLQSMTSGRKLQMRKGVVAMVFSSLLFLFRFLPAVLILYFLAPRRWRNLVLLLFSLAFYAWGEPVYLVPDARLDPGLLLPAVFSWTAFCGRERSRSARVALIGSSVVSLSLLGFFKYADFVIGTVNGLTGSELRLLEAWHSRSVFHFIRFRRCPTRSTSTVERRRCRRISSPLEHMSRCFRS